MINSGADAETRDVSFTAHIRPNDIKKGHVIMPFPLTLPQGAHNVQLAVHSSTVPMMFALGTREGAPGGGHVFSPLPGASLTTTNRQYAYNFHGQSNSPFQSNPIPIESGDGKGAILSRLDQQRKAGEADPSKALERNDGTFGHPFTVMSPDHHLPQFVKTVMTAKQANKINLEQYVQGDGSYRVPTPVYGKLSKQFSDAVATANNQSTGLYLALAPCAADSHHEQLCDGTAHTDPFNPFGMQHHVTVHARVGTTRNGDTRAELIAQAALGASVPVEEIEKHLRTLDVAQTAGRRSTSPEPKECKAGDKDAGGDSGSDEE